MERPVEWKCKNYTYECDKTCTSTTEFQVTQSGNDSTLWIRDVTNECLSWTFYDNNNNFGKFDLKTNAFTKAETYEITQNGKWIYKPFPPFKLNTVFSNFSSISIS
ncbi:uncharacterized protein LOC106878976 [Octopus bimaculoides]|uniref:Uncharacterized protein n=1 Tax=Octopus bimaculoides TaxID=37653 RepID=A0A0L8G6Y2_OCTBM|nr:uncharacterized protein LOC106878976 [Octopus bimaculoides]|eukprot:XP_014783837.1 PREDICTED: uncharacterized protein LOC106878976 [Octopus bimaculoides]